MLVHQRCSAIQGESQARTARSARGQDGAGGGMAASVPISPRPGPGRGAADRGAMRGRRTNQACQQKQKAQLTSTWWRRMAISERTWKSAHPSSSLTCL